ncbi:MAG TPA: radical SAM protein [Candidatus Methanoperedenaceae archaeon]|nr:radical SAM protein [Candidatus Methanoperedenaceae archaeon]
MEKVRASLGTLGVLGMELIRMDTPPTTAYLQIYTEKRCDSNCLFCAQAASSSADISNIARGIYTPADLTKVMTRLAAAYARGHLKRACVQTMKYAGWWEDTLHLIGRIRNSCDIPISVSVFPLPDNKYQELRQLGADSIVIPLDACSEKLFDKIKGKSANGAFRWETHLLGLERAVGVFGRWNVGTHLIIGLGERGEDALRLIERLHKSGINTALFAYTPVEGNQLALPQPDMRHYRSIQIGHYIITEGLSPVCDMTFTAGEVVGFGVEPNILRKVIDSGEAFITAGCDGCNRPLATEYASSAYNFPKQPDKGELETIRRMFRL